MRCWTNLHGTVITEFRGAYAFLSNFYRAPFEYNGKKYETVEHAYQSFKAVHEADQELVRLQMSPVDARAVGRRVERRADFDEIRLALMLELVRCKFKQNEELKRKLLDTRDFVLIEGNNWGDVFWGVGLQSGLGDNHLGEILMRVRKELHA